MLKLTILALAILGVSGVYGSPYGYTKGYNNRIVGGEEVDISEFPYIVTVDYNGLLSVGTIISEQYGVTCASFFLMFDFKAVIRSGSSFNDQGGTIHQVEYVKLSKHRQFGYFNDGLAVFKVQTPFVFGPLVQPIGLPSVNQHVPDGTLAVTAGWGIIDAQLHKAKKLRAVKVPTINNLACIRFWQGEVTEAHICTGYPRGGKGSCSGDDGAPLVSNGTLIGIGVGSIITQPSECEDPQSPYPYLSIPVYRNFIEEVTGF